MDGRFFDDVGNVRVTSGQLEFYNSDGTTRRTVLRHVRMGKGVVQADYTYHSNIDAGIILNYQDPENFGVVLLDDTGTAVAVRYVEFVDGQKQATRATRASGSGFSLTNGNSYTVKCVIDNDPGNSNLQQLTVYVGGTQRLQTTDVDDTWEGGGQVGFYRATSNITTTVEWDNFKCGKDANSNGSLGSGDYIYADYDFNDPGGSTWQKLTFVHDDAGNLTNDGLFQYQYDAWNRLTEVYYAAGSAADSNQRVAKYEYDGLFRRTRKIVANQGSGVVAGSDEGGTITGIEAGDREERYYYAGWRLTEIRDGSDDTLGQFTYGTQYIDEPICYDRDTDSDNDCLDAGSRRYFYHQDANYRVVMLTSESGTVIERYDYSAYGEPVVLKGGSTEAGNSLFVSSVGNPLTHQGLFRDPESQSYQNRFRQLLARNGRFAQRDPLGGMNLLEYVYSAPPSFVDPLGLEPAGGHHVYPLYLGGNPKGVLIDLTEAQHTAAHAYFESKGLGHRGGNGEAARKKWEKLSESKRREHVRNSLQAAGVKEKEIDAKVNQAFKGQKNLPGKNFSPYRGASEAKINRIIKNAGRYGLTFIFALAESTDAFADDNSKCGQWVEAALANNCDSMPPLADECYEELAAKGLHAVGSSFLFGPLGPNHPELSPANKAHSACTERTKKCKPAPSPRKPGEPPTLN